MANCAMVVRMPRAVTASRVAEVVGRLERPAYVGLADRVRLAIGDGRIPHGVRLPSERDLTARLGLSRTTVTRAYALLVEEGYAVARQGSGTFTRIPGGRERTLDRALTTRVGDEAVAIDLNCAASSAPPGVAEAYQAAVAELPAYLSGHGYFPAGLPDLQRLLAQRYAERGLPTEPGQIVVTPGALAATAVVARAVIRPGDRVLVEVPGYPNAAEAFAGCGARLSTVPVDRDGWDLALLESTTRRLRPRLAYLVADFHNPTSRLMSEEQRAAVARLLAASGTLVVVDESHQQLSLDGSPMPRPLALHVAEAGGRSVTVGAASKVLWGGLRMGWARVDPALAEQFSRARLSLDLGTPVVEQLALIHLLRHPGPALGFHRARLREQRDALAAALGSRLPDWQFDLPDGGLALWCRLPAPVAAALSQEAERRGLAVVAGPVFAPDGGLASWLRVPYTRPVEELQAAVGILAEAWPVALASADRPGRPRRSIVA